MVKKELNMTRNIKQKVLTISLTAVAMTQIALVYFANAMA